MIWAPPSTPSRRTRTSPRSSVPAFVSSFVTYKRNELARFNHYVTDWEFREYAYHL